MLERSRGAVECGRVRSCVVGCAPVCPSVPHPKLRFTVKKSGGWIPLKIVIIEKTSGRGPTRFKLLAFRVGILPSQIYIYCKNNRTKI